MSKKRIVITGRKDFILDFFGLTHAALQQMASQSIFSVETFPDQNDALSALTETGQATSLILANIQKPAVSALEFVSLCRCTLPDVNVIVTCEEKSMADEALLYGARVIGYPFRRDEFLKEFYLSLLCRTQEKRREISEIVAVLGCSRPF